jgi:phospholipase C
MRFHQPRLAALSLGGFLFALTACSPDATTSPSASSAARVAAGAAANADDLKSEGEGLARLQHIVVIYLENRSFDNLYGEFPGANGLANAGAHATQVDREVLDAG